MNEHRHEFSLLLMCRVLKVARAGFYQWLHQPVSERAKEDARLVEVIRDSYSASRAAFLDVLTRIPIDRSHCLSLDMSVARECLAAGFHHVNPCGPRRA